ncbi:MAG TPA: amidase [Solirubrobacterales bacterium]
MAGRSAAEQVDASLRRIAALDDRVGAFATVLADPARAEAAERDRGGARGPLHGVPLGVKDNIDTVGVATTAGVPYRAGCLPQRDAEAVAALKRAGAVMVGKTTMHELAFGGTSQNLYHGPARNPWDLGRTPGGSSGGSACAVAAAMVPLALGTDTGGSVRIPAALTGIYGLRPTRRLLGARGVVPVAPSLDTVGLFARTAAELAALLDGAAGTATGPALAGFEPAGLRVGIAGGFFRAGVDPEVLAAVDALAEALAGIGMQPIPVELAAAEELFEATRALLWSEAFAAHEGALRDHADALPPRVRGRLEGGAAVSGAEYARSREWIRGWRRTVAATLAEVDLVLSPTTGATAPTVEEAEAVEDERLLTRFTHPWSFDRGPSLSVPCGFDRRGLPIGAHLFGRPGAEATLLGVAAAYEGLTDWTRRLPPLVEGADHDPKLPPPDETCIDPP